MGTALQEKGQFDEAIQCYKKAIEIDPDYVDARWNMSLLNLLCGNFKEGWKGYEWRWKLEGILVERNFSAPAWNGYDIKGRTILIYAEQGLGDTIQFVRYASLVADLGANVIVECQKELVSLVEKIRGIKQVIPYGNSLPEFDIHCSLLSLPLVFDTTLEDIPANIPYIYAGSPSVQKWRDKIDQTSSHIRIGLVWAGDPAKKKDRDRSCSLRLFSSLAQFNDVIFYSLQKGEASNQAMNPPEGMNLIDYTEEFHDFSDTAAFIENLDLVISVDTAVAHLAGSLGKPVWTLLPFVPDWRWMLSREDSPWYPTMRLFRQPRIGDWGSVIDRVVNALRGFIISHEKAA